MPFGTTFENDLLKLIFNAVDIANIADDAATSPLTNLYVSLHTADPHGGDAQTTSEATYTSYAREAVVRSGAGWTVTGSAASPAADIDFTEATGGSETLTYVGIGTASTGTGKLLASGALSPTIPVTTGTIPRVKDTTTVTLS